MASLFSVQIMNMIGVGPAANRNAIIADLLSEGLDGLKHMTDEEVRDTCASYAKRTDNPFPVILTPVQKQRIKSLVLWVKDQERIDKYWLFWVLPRRHSSGLHLRKRWRGRGDAKTRKRRERRILTRLSTRSSSLRYSGKSGRRNCTQTCARSLELEEFPLLM